MNSACGGTLLPTPAVDESRDYEKPTRPRKSRGLDTYGFCWLRRKPTARQGAVGPSRRAGRLGGRACLCDTTTMHATRRRTAAERVKNLSHVHPVHPRPVRVDAKNRQTAARFSNYVHASTPICNVHAELKGKMPQRRLSRYKRYADWGGRLDAVCVSPPPSCDYLRPPKSVKGGRGGHLSDGVIL